ncbi:MAG: contractile injection system tape measure protein [Coleofasciculus chthonoplastes F3-SA18-01]|uniref:contractile injection system tape measure protein n=1 Tax=Coleofasciculus chthonoplastes TaxID=64178 RepID=UPI0033047AC6
MSDQRHQIKTQIIELQLSGQQDALELQKTVTQLYYSKVVPLIEKLCDQLSDSRTIHRIETLEINLGTIDIDDFEQEYITKIEAEIKQQLTEIIQPSGMSMAMDRETGETGTNVLVEHREAGNASGSMSGLHKTFKGTKGVGFRSSTQPTKLTYTHASQSRQPIPPRPENVPLSPQTTDLERISYFLQTGTLPWWSEILSKKALAESCDRVITTSPNLIKPIFWQAFQQERQLKRLIYQFNDELLLKIANLFVPSLSDFIADYNSDILGILKRNDFIKVIPQNLIRLEQWRGIFLSLPFDKTVTPGKRQITEKSLGYLATRFQLNYFDLVNQMVKTVDSLKREGKSGKSELPEIIAELVASSSRETLVKENSVRELDLPISSETIQNFNNTNEIYINNGGLVLLHPFLNHFFQTIGLVQKKSFINSAAAERAVLLIQYLVEAVTELSEPSLSLNKVLCGIDVLEPVETTLDITEQEQLEGETLLTAVIQNWSILKNTSIAGFRQAFLQRKGILRIRDGNWLLQVEPETYDVLLEQLPWNINIIKLPWMNNVLYVQWS